MNTRTKWSVVLLFVLICVIGLTLPAAVYVGFVADDGTKNDLREFFAELHPRNITKMAQGKDTWSDWMRDFKNNVSFLWETATRR